MLPPLSSIRKQSMERTFQELDKVEHPTIMEVGRARSLRGAEGDGHSTLHFAAYALRTGGALVSIDNDARTEDLCRPLLNAAGLWGARIVYVNTPAEQFHVPEVRSIDLLYLDGPDCDGGSQQASSQWHLDCTKFMEPCVSLGGLILIDDCMSPGIPAGKGMLAIPYLLSRGYEVLHEGYQWLLRKPS